MLNQTPAPAGDPCEIVSSRTFAAPRHALFDAFRDPEQLARWWGPTGFTNTFHVFDLKPGGAWRFTMHGPDGASHPMTKSFIDIVPNERVVYRNEHATHGFVMTMTFAETEAGTRLTWRMRFDTEQEARKVRSVIEGANEQNFDRLSAHLASG